MAQTTRIYLKKTIQVMELVYDEDIMEPEMLNRPLRDVDDVFNKGLEEALEEFGGYVLLKTEIIREVN